MLQLLCPLQVQLGLALSSRTAVPAFITLCVSQLLWEAGSSLGTNSFGNSPQLQELIGTISKEQDPDFWLWLWPAWQCLDVTGTAGKGNCSVSQRDPEPGEVRAECCDLRLRTWFAVPFEGTACSSESFTLLHQIRLLKEQG